MTEPVLLSVTGGVARIRFNRPGRLNALDPAVATGFRDAVAVATTDRSVRVIVLSGEGRAFMAGGDLAYLKTASDRAAAARTLIAPVNEALLMLDRSGRPSIAALHGAVAGAGMSLALCADLAVAADTVRFNMAYLRVGAPPDCGGSWALARLVGPRRALELALLCEPVDAREALAMGLVNRVVSAADLDATVEGLAARIAAGPALATRRTRDLIAQAPVVSLETQLAAEIDAFAECAATQDFSEAVGAFFEKRAPVFARD